MTTATAKTSGKAATRKPVTTDTEEKVKPTTANYICTRPVLVNGEKHHTGTTVALDEKTARPLLVCGAIAMQASSGD